MVKLDSKKGETEQGEKTNYEQIDNSTGQEQMQIEGSNLASAPTMPINSIDTGVPISSDPLLNDKPINEEALRNFMKKEEEALSQKNKLNNKSFEQIFQDLKNLNFLNNFKNFNNDNTIQNNQNA